MRNTILLVFEGSRAECQVFESVKRHFFERSKDAVVHAIFGADVYQLWRIVSTDPFLDLVEVLRERSMDNQSNLEGIQREQVSQIFLFFDYDGHATMADDNDLQQMLELFNEETEKGKLYVSYPMIEALKDMTENFQHHTVPAKANIHYKKQVGERTPYQDVRQLDYSTWSMLIVENHKKAHFIIRDIYAVMNLPINQRLILEKQIQKYILPKNHIAVLSGIPFFISEYFGDSVLDSKA